MFHDEEIDDMGGEQIFDADIKKEYIELVDSCLNSDTTQNIGSLTSFSKKFCLVQEEARQILEKFRREVSRLPLASVIIRWAEEIGRDRVVGKRYIHLMSELLKNGVFNLTTECKTEKKSITLGEIFMRYGKQLEPLPEKIRCISDWSIDKQEETILFICEFSRWLQNETFGMVRCIVDSDRKITSLREIPYEKYIEILKEMDFRDRVIAKFCYLCGVSDVRILLNLQINDLMILSRGRVKAGAHRFTLPLHLIKDLQKLIGERKNGFVFEGKNGGRLNNTTPYRSLKTVAAKLNLPDSFTFHHFSRNR